MKRWLLSIKKTESKQSTATMTQLQKTKLKGTRACRSRLLMMILVKHSLTNTSSEGGHSYPSTSIIIQ